MQVGRIEGNHPAGDGGNVPQPRLVRAAHEFEGQMMQELLKPMTESDGLTGDDADASTGSGAVLGEFAAQSLGQAISQRGGFGIAERIIGQISHSGKVTNSHPGNH